jgi:hypothetical protein
MNSFLKILKLYNFPSIYYNNIVIMSSEIIQSVAYDNYDDFQHFNFIFFTRLHFVILRIENFIMTSRYLGRKVHRLT